MSHRLQVLVPERLQDRLRKAARRARVSNGEFVRRAIEDAVRRQAATSAVDELARLNAPTSDIEEMIAETERGRWA
jgi:predicted transcriptional regulator